MDRRFWNFGQRIEVGAGLGLFWVGEAQEAREIRCFLACGAQHQTIGRECLMR